MASVSFGSIKIDGLESALKDIDRYSADVQKKISNELQAFCLIVVQKGKRAAAKNYGRLAQGISYVKVDDLNFVIISAADYSAFMEFGTKSKTQIPAGYESLARQFKGMKIDSGGISLKQAIYTWADKKGINKKIWWAIYNKIVKVGVTPHPFLIPAILEEQPKLLNRVKNILSI